jgi:DNA-binding NarL/FixJ family response regulator
VHNLSPRIEYYALIARLRGDETLRETFVLVAGDDDAGNDMSDLLQCGADATIDRPIDPDIVLEVVGHVFAHRLISKPRTTEPSRLIRFRRD